jgi:Na+/melibiose symporter-like transporter
MLNDDPGPPRPGVASTDNLPLRVKVGFAWGQVAGQIFRDIPSLLLLFYMTNVLGIGPAVAGSAIFLPKLFWGVASDMAVGVISDRVSARFPRRYWLLIGTVMGPTAMVLLFNVPRVSNSLEVLYIVCVFALYMISFATFSVPYLAQYSEITSDPRERTVLMAWRHTFTGVGLLMGASLTPAAVHMLGGGRSAYAAWSWALAAVCGSSLLIAFFSTPKVRASTVAKVQLNLKDLVGVLAYAPYAILLGVAFVQQCGAGLSYAGIAYFVTYNMGRTDALLQLGIITLLAAGTVILCSPIWVLVAKRIGKRRTFVLAAVLNGVTQLVWSQSGGAPLGVIYAYSVGIGVFNAGWGIMSLAMLADIIAEAKRETGRDRAGSFSALWSLSEKIGLALGGTLLAGVILGAFGFHHSNAHAAAPLPKTLIGIALVFAVLPGVVNLACAIIYGCFGRSIETGATIADQPQTVGDFVEI